MLAAPVLSSQHADRNNERKKIMQPLPDEPTLWRAVSERSVEFDGAFVYAVLSTGIYCRPVCPSRRPRREGVRYFAAPAEAEAAGFRACQRCQPEAARSNWVQQACRRMDETPENSPPLPELARELGLSPSHLRRLFRAELGITPHQYAAARRLERFKAGVREGQAVTDAIYGAGYGSSSRLYENAAARLGMTPGAYRKGGAGLLIRYTLVDGWLGRMLLAGTERGLCMLSLGDTDALLEAALRVEFPAARLVRDDAALAAWAAAVLQYLDGSPALDLPLDVQATAFQSRVWQALRAIPFGQTRTYSEIAESIGQPRAARAVGHACAANPVSLVTPCHRALRQDGSLGGYRWGLERKRRLLALEQGKGEG